MLLILQGMDKLYGFTQGVCKYGKGEWREPWIPTMNPASPLQAVSPLKLLEHQGLAKTPDFRFMAMLPVTPVWDVFLFRDKYVLGICSQSHSVMACNLE